MPSAIEGAPLNFNERLRRKMRKICAIALGTLALGVALLKIHLPSGNVAVFPDQWKIGKMCLPQSKELVFKSAH